jgi:flavin-dependent dehydrogenase
VTKKELAKWKSRIGIDIGRIRGGYGWVFPKANHLSIGIAAPVERAKGLKNIYYEYLDSLKLGQRTILRWTASQLPICIGQPIVSQPRAILIGDAAGLADPLSGEGLYNAILSAKLGGNSIERAITNCDVTLNDYSDAVATKIVPQMKIAYIFSKVLSQLPKQLFGVLNKDERVWQTCSKMLRGEIDYVTIKNKVSNLGGLYSLVSRI